MLLCPREPLESCAIDKHVGNAMQPNYGEEKLCFRKDTDHFAAQEVILLEKDGRIEQEGSDRRRKGVGKKDRFVRHGSVAISERGRERGNSSRKKR